MEKVRYGIIGYGNIGNVHAKNLVAGKIQNAELTAIADINPAKLVAAKTVVPETVALFDDAESMMKSGLVDVVVIAIPHYFHAEMAILAFKYNLNVISEKPAGVYTKQAREMNEAAAKSDKLFGIMFQNRTNPLYIKMHEMIANGELGDIKRTSLVVTDWYRSQSYYDSGSWRATWAGEGGGVLLNQCPHSLDLWQWVVGMLPSKVRAFCHNGKWHNIEVEDDVTAYVEYPNGATGIFVTCTADTPGTNRFEIQGDLGKLVCADNKLLFYKLKQGEREFNATYTGGFGEPKFELIAVETPGEFTEHAGILNDFTKALITGSPLFIPGYEGIKGLTISNAIHLSSWLDKTIDLPFDEDLFLSELNKRVKTSSYKAGSEDKILNTEGSY